MSEESNVKVLSDLDASREVGNNWFFEEKELQMFVASGEMKLSGEMLDPNTGESTGALLLHYLKWDDDRCFADRENSFVTTMRRVGRSNDQSVSTTDTKSIDAKLYNSVINSGVLKIPKGNGEFTEDEKTREEMLEFARLFPESAADAVESWLECANFEIYGADRNSFDWLFVEQSVVKVLWYLGERHDPVAAGILTFKSPTSEARKRYNEEVQIVKTKRQGDQNIAQVSENFGKKLQYGLTHLLNVEGIAVGNAGVKFTESMKKEFVLNFNPIWFVEAVETMHESFNFTRGKPNVN